MPMPKMKFNFLRKNKDVIGAYNRLFSSHDGKIVLQDLMQQHNVLKPIFDADPQKMALNEGGRNAILRIMKFLSIEEKQLEAMTREHVERDAQYFEEDEYA